MRPSRRLLLGIAAQSLLAGAGLRPAQALPLQRLTFPRDFGSHSQFRTEWWYITGYGRAPDGRLLGFQLTFFRTRVDEAQSIRSRFAARQLIFAHVAVTDLQGGRLWHDQAIAREGFGLAQAAPNDTDLRLDRWQLRREGPVEASTYRALLPAREIALDLNFKTTQPLLLQGQQGLSRKGPDPRQASYYYSQPQMVARGLIGLPGKRMPIEGRAWLDHEWSEEILHPEAVGWDWIGMNFNDGSALTAFRLRRADGSSLWAGGSFRSADGRLRNFAPDEVDMQALRYWSSPLSQARYPVQWRVEIPVGRYTVNALLDAQELDSRGSTGAIYWEGLSELLDASGQRIGLGYLEMTGYAAPLRLN
jgi:predicted secreted hydrolase